MSFLFSDTIASRIKEAGFSISQMKETTLTRQMAEEIYQDPKGKDFYDRLINYMSKWVVLKLVLRVQDLPALSKLYLSHHTYTHNSMIVNGFLQQKRIWMCIVLFSLKDDYA